MCAYWWRSVRPIWKLHSLLSLNKILRVGGFPSTHVNAAETLLIVITYTSCRGGSQPPHTYIGRWMIEPWGHHGAFLTIFEFFRVKMQCKAYILY